MEKLNTIKEDFYFLQFQNLFCSSRIYSRTRDIFLK